MVWVANLSNCESLEEKNGKVTEVLSDRTSLAKDKKDNRMEVKTGRDKLTIAFSIFV